MVSHQQSGITSKVNIPLNGSIFSQKRKVRLLKQVQSKMRLTSFLSKWKEILMRLKRTWHNHRYRTELFLLILSYYFSFGIIFVTFVNNVNYCIICVTFDNLLTFYCRKMRIHQAQAGKDLLMGSLLTPLIDPVQEPRLAQGKPISRR